MFVSKNVDTSFTLRFLLLLFVTLWTSYMVFQYWGLGELRNRSFYQAAHDEATAADLAVLPACPRSSAEYVSRMGRRGFSAKRVTAPKNNRSLKDGDALLLHFQAGSQATSKNLPDSEEVRLRVLRRMHTVNKPASLLACPFWLEAARIRAIEDMREGGGVTGLEGFGDVVATCDAEEALQTYLEADLFNRHLSYKQCTAKTCLSKTRRACQKFIDTNGKSPLPVFRYDTFGKEGKAVDVGVSLSETPGLRVVKNPDDACLFVFDGPEVGIDEMKQWVRETNFTFERLEHWNLVDDVPGRNHVLWRPNCLVRCDYDATRSEHGPIGEALVISPVHLNSMFRPEFDIALPPRFRPMVRKVFEAKQPREYDAPNTKLFFRGSVTGETKWDMDRMIASAYSNEPRDGFIVQSLIRPDGSSTGITACDVHTTDPAYNASYVEMMSTAFFAFTPGGGGAYSFRLAEALSGGAIPVVTEDLVLPFYSISSYPAEELWRSCAVLVSSDEVYGLGFVIDAVLAEGAEKFERRRKSCEKLWNDLFFDNDYFLDTKNIRSAYFRGGTRTVVKELAYRLLN